MGRQRITAGWWTICALALVGVGIGTPLAGAEQPPVPSFANEVTPLLTRAGCNQGACHGKGAGQNGFRLSLRGYAPEWDHSWITRDHAGRRISLGVPEDSLLLGKALARVPHGGGRVIAEGSREHRLLVDWIAAGAPGPIKDEPRIERLELQPAERTFQLGEEQAFTAIAHWNDGRASDVTWLTQWASNDAGVVEMGRDEVARAMLAGQTAVRAQFLGQVAVAICTLPYEHTVDRNEFVPRNLIDEYVLEKLAALGIPPSGPATDAEFFRRAFLDLIGTLPTPDETRAFLADTRPDKRERLIDDLLARPEYADFWALQFSDLFQNRRERDHDVRGSKGVRGFHGWLREQVAANRPWNELATAVLTASGPATQQPQVGYYVVTIGEQGPENSDVTASVAQAFLGTRIGCAKCHNHPLERYTQDDYYHFAAFFSRVRMERKDPQQGPTSLLFLPPEANQQVGVTQPRTGQFLAPRPLDRSQTPLDPAVDPRVALAQWMTNPANEQFSGAIVNRLWRHFMKVGLVEPVDDLRSTNPPTNPALWRALSQELVGHGYDLKHLMRLIVSSRTYQATYITRPENQSETGFYSRYYPRKLPAEVMLDAISQATGVPDQFPGYPLGMRAIQMPDPGVSSYFLWLFGRSERVTACACERSEDVTLSQSLHLVNYNTLGPKLSSPDGRLAKLLASGMDNAQLTEELYFVTFSRPPREDEIAAVEVHMAKVLGEGQDRRVAFEDVFWALLNSKEFLFNR